VGTSLRSSGSSLWQEKGGGSILVINGAGGVGSILIQIARRLTGLTVIATASRPETIEWVKQMGAHYVIDHHKPLDEELARIGHPEVNYVAGLTASDQYLPLFPKIVAAQGHIALIDDPATFDIVPLKRRRSLLPGSSCLLGPSSRPKT
jgi:NADPH:quinone reductase-like Zn-dependent oxidoreductase